MCKHDFTYQGVSVRVRLRKSGWFHSGVTKYANGPFDSDVEAVSDAAEKIDEAQS
jgi:hypothetical protein